MRPTRAKTIEGLTERMRQKLEKGEPKYGRGQNPGSHTETGQRYKRDTNLIPNQHKFPKGNCANPGGRPKNDIAAQIARAIFEDNKEKLYLAYAKACLKGNAYAFQVLAERAYGKLKERHEYELTPYRDTSEADIHARIAEIESRLGYQGISQSAGQSKRTPGLTGGTESASQRTEPQILPPED